MNKKLNILWTSADPLTFKHMIYMYAKNSKIQKWWDEVEIIIWGATAKLVAEDQEIQGNINELKQIGIKVSVCVSCARQLEVADKIMDLNLELKGQGVPLTDILKNDEKLLTI